MGTHHIYEKVDTMTYYNHHHRNVLLPQAITHFMKVKYNIFSHTLRVELQAVCGMVRFHWKFRERCWRWGKLLGKYIGIHTPRAKCGNRELQSTSRCNMWTVKWHLHKSRRMVKSPLPHKCGFCLNKFSSRFTCGIRISKIKWPKTVWNKRNVTETIMRARGLLGPFKSVKYTLLTSFDMMWSVLRPCERVWTRGCLKVNRVLQKKKLI